MQPTRLVLAAACPVLALLLSCAQHALAVDQITFRHENRPIQVDGKAILEAADGGVLFLATDGGLWPVPAEQLVERKQNDIPFAPLDAHELSVRLLREAGPDFAIFKTPHYLVCYNTSREYAQWCASLFERLYRVFNNFWSRKGFDLREPEFPLVAMVFNNRQAYRDYARPELKETTDSVVGYYSLQTNRMTMFDLTGLEASRFSTGRQRVSQKIETILSQPSAERNVATIVHEATHQIAFNCGLQTRYADIPLWVSEGIAVYFETPDLASEKGWRSIGGVNAFRLEQFREYLPRRPDNSLATLVADDRRFRDSKTAHDAYAEAWALNYLLLRQRSKQYVAYLKKLSTKQPLTWDNPETRLAEFTEAFGSIEKLDSDLVRYIATLP
jgi:hypothetical protein